MGAARPRRRPSMRRHRRWRRAAFHRVSTIPLSGGVSPRWVLPTASARRPYAARARKQRERFQLPPLPTTAVGAFPQTAELRALRETYRQGGLRHLDYLEDLRAHLKFAIERQLAYGLDVLVHGAAERDDGVEYFAELLWGCAISERGWVQTEGARCVKPPLIYGDVSAPEPMTVGWAQYAQGLTDKPVKGMLTGPVTMLQGAFVRDDQPRATTALQIALALRDEVKALEAAGIGMIQIDEPALCAGLPLRAEDRADYVSWAVYAFRVCASGAADETQIHTHLRDPDAGDVLCAIAEFDADVMSIETLCSSAERLDACPSFDYPNEIGAGIYDLRAPRVPSAIEMHGRIACALGRIPAERLWVNPGCGLKTREWAQVDLALPRMVEAAQLARAACCAS